MKYSYAYLLMLLVCQPAFSQPVSTTNTVFYPIVGASAHDLRAEMDVNGPLENGKHYYANTRYYVKWAFYTQQQGDSCVLSDISVTVDTVYTYPQWQNYSSASPLMQQNWDRYYSRLQTHEQGHASHGANAGIEVEDKLRNMPFMENCAGLSAAANKEAYAILNKYQQSDITYDAETEYGKKQGAILND